MSYEDFTGALERFKHATARLAEAWDPSYGDVLGDTYPDYLPSFDEFSADVQAMEATPQSERNTVVIEVVKGSLAEEDVTAVLRSAGAKVIEYRHE